MTGAVHLLRDKQGIRDIRVRHTRVFFTITYIVKVGGTTDVSRDIRVIRDIGAQDTEISLYYKHVLTRLCILCVINRYKGTKISIFLSSIS